MSNVIFSPQSGNTQLGPRESFGISSSGKSKQHKAYRIFDALVGQNVISAYFIGQFCILGVLYDIYSIYSIRYHFLRVIHISSTRTHNVLF